MPALLIGLGTYDPKLRLIDPGPLLPDFYTHTSNLVLSIALVLIYGPDPDRDGRAHLGGRRLRGGGGLVGSVPAGALIVAIQRWGLRRGGGGV